MSRIALFLPSLRGGGAERVGVTLANGFAARDHTVDVVLASATGPYLEDVSDGVSVVDLRAPRLRYAVWPLVRYLRRARPDVLHAMSRDANVVASAARRLAGTRTRVVFAQHSHLSSVRDAVAGQARPLRLWWLRRTYAAADAIVTPSRDVADDLRTALRLEGTPVHTIHNPIVTPELRRLRDEPLDHPWFAPGAPPVILGVGRLAVAKDFGTLVRAFARVREAAEARLMILGEGPDRPALERSAEELGVAADVALPGFTRNPYPYMRGAAVFVLSSRWEGFGNVLVEAMACGAAVVSTRCPGGPAEILEHGRWGALVEVGDVDGMARAIMETLASPRKDASARAEAFSAERSVDAYLAVLLGPAGG